MKPTIAVYPGTFDPLTRGHEDLVRRAANLADHVIVAVAESSGKNPIFNLAERVHIAQEALSSYPNVTVKGFDGLLMDFLEQNHARLLIRGLRAVSDFEYEFQMAGMNRKLNPNIETVFLTPSEEFMFISATIVREIARLGGDVAQFVPPGVCQHLHQKLKHAKGV